MQKSKPFILLLILLLLAWPLQAQKKAPPRKPASPKPTTAPNATKPEEPEEEDLLPPPKPKPPLKPEDPFGRIVLLPLDDRPAAGQFAQMIGAIADHEVILPPKEMLGRFTTPGDTKKIQDWLSIVDYSKIDAVVISVDMLAYGGLVASRTSDTTPAEALKRLEIFRWIKHKHPEVPIYAFNVLLRVAPTARKETRAWQIDLTRWAELTDRVPKTKDAKLAGELEQLKKKLDRNLLDDYFLTRRRDLQINLAMVKLYEEHIIDNLLFLPDDTREFGPHRHEQVILRERLKALGFDDEVPLYNGAEEGYLSLVSRAILDKQKQKIKVAVVYSSEKGRKVIAPFENDPLEVIVKNQLQVAGAMLAEDAAQADYTLYVNARETDDKEFEAFLKQMIADLKANKPIALADVLLRRPEESGADERIIKALGLDKVIDKLLAFAVLDTPGNTLGTIIPTANLRVFSKQLPDAPQRAARTRVAAQEFLLQRLASDYLYPNLVRFDINAQLRKPPALPADEFTDEMYQRINKQVQEKLQPLVEKFFAENFQGKTYALGTFNNTSREIKINALKGLKIYLPWPRPVESAIEYKFAYTAN